MIAACVVDASVGIKLFLEEEGTDQATRLLQGLAQNPAARFYVPDLFFVECANILWKYARRFDYPAENAHQDLVDLHALALRSVSTADLISPALELALDHEISAYDACYAALAQGANLPLITADLPLARKLAPSDIEVLLLKDL
jgi:predicted nucleic acid-binding protein